MSHQALEPWVATQEKTFRNWANFYLKQRNIKINNLAEDLRDGVVLFNLVEILTGQSLGKCHPSPKLPPMKVENINKALHAVGGIQGVSAEDVMNGNLKLILGAMWFLIQKFQIQAGEDDEGNGGHHMSGRDTILNWIQNYVPEAVEGIDLKKEAPRAFNDGKILSHIVKKADPDAPINLKLLKHKPALDTVEVALNAAEKFGAPKLIDASDMACEHPDEQSILTYLGSLKTTIEQREKARGLQEKVQESKNKTKDLKDRLNAQSARKKQELENLRKKAAEDESLADVQVAAFEIKEVTPEQKEIPCELCTKPLKSGKIVEVENLDGSQNIYHLHCFVCFTCKKPFTEHFWRVQGKPYCKEHHRIAQGFVCARCSKAIIETPIEALSKFYHKDCFLCTQCNTSLSGGFFDLTGTPACGNCYKTKKPSKYTCFNCKLPIQGPVLDACDKKWHDPDCFVCTKCKKKLGDDFVSDKGLPYCDKCS